MRVRERGAFSGVRDECQQEEGKSWNKKNGVHGGSGNADRGGSVNADRSGCVNAVRPTGMGLFKWNAVDHSLRGTWFHP